MGKLTTREVRALLWLAKFCVIGFDRGVWGEKIASSALTCSRHPTKSQSMINCSLVDQRLCSSSHGRQISRRVPSRLSDWTVFNVGRLGLSIGFMRRMLCLKGTSAFRGTVLTGPIRILGGEMAGLGKYKLGG